MNGGSQGRGNTRQSGGGKQRAPGTGLTEYGDLYRDPFSEQMYSPYGEVEDSPYFQETPTIEQILSYGLGEGNIGSAEQFVGTEDILEGRFGEGRHGLYQFLLRQMADAERYGLNKEELTEGRLLHALHQISQYGDLSKLSKEQMDELSGSSVFQLPGVQQGADGGTRSILEALVRGQQLIDAEGISSDYNRGMTAIDKKLEGDLGAMQSSYAKAEKGDRYKNLLSGITTPSQGGSIRDTYMRNRGKLITDADTQRAEQVKGLETGFYGGITDWQDELWS